MEHIKTPTYLEEMLRRQEAKEEAKIDKDNTHKLSEYEEVLAKLQMMSDEIARLRIENEKNLKKEHFTAENEENTKKTSTDLVLEAINPQDEFKIQSVKLANLLARGAFRTSSVWTERIFTIICKDITATNKIKDRYVFGKNDLSRSIGGNTDESIKSIAETVTKETIEFSLEVMNSAKTAEQKKEAAKAKAATIKAGGSFNIFSHSLWEESSKKIAVSLNHDIRPYLLTHAANYTAYSDTTFLELRSVYGQRLFRIIMANARLIKNKNGFAITTEELYFVLNPPAKFRQNFAVFEREILAKAIKDIREHTWLRFTYEKQKTGAKITSIYIMVINNLMIPAKKTMQIGETQVKTAQE